MKLSFQKLHIALLLAEYKMAGLVKNQKAQQETLEKIVLCRTHLRIELEQQANKLLFNNNL